MKIVMTARASATQSPHASRRSISMLAVGCSRTVTSNSRIGPLQERTLSKIQAKNRINPRERKSWRIIRSSHSLSKVVPGFTRIMDLATW